MRLPAEEGGGPGPGGGLEAGGSGGGGIGEGGGSAGGGSGAGGEGGSGGKSAAAAEGRCRTAGFNFGRSAMDGEQNNYKLLIV